MQAETNTASGAATAPTSTLGSGWTNPTDGVHQFPIRVYYEDTDALGIVYYVNYLKFAERARTEMLRLHGHDQYDLLAEQGIGFTVRRCEVDYHAPARLDDVLEVQSSLEALRGASLNLNQSVMRDGVLLAQLKLKIACVDAAGKAVRVPDEIRALFEPPDGDRADGSE
jgi:acyl-CoA thioester hydrolase